MNLISWTPTHDLVEKLQQQTNQLQKVGLSPKNDPILSLKSVITPLLNTINEHPPLKKLFVRWLGEKGLQTNGMLDPQQVAQHLLKVDDWQGKIEYLQKKILKLTQKFLSNNFINQIPIHFKDLKPEVLDKKLWKSYHGILSTLVEISKIKKLESPNIEKIIKELNVWCLHYLVVPAKPSLIDIPGDETHYPFGEYDRDNRPHYHREDGGAIVQKFISELVKKYPCLQELQVNLIKNETFPNLINEFCSLFGNSNNNNDIEPPTQYLKIYNTNDLDKAKQHPLNHPSSTLFLDFSNYVQDQLSEGSEQCSIVNKLCDLIKDFTNVNMIYGAAVNIGGQDCYFFCSKDPKLLKEFQDDFKDFLGSHGAYPEIMLLKGLLLDLGYDISKTFLNSYPLEKRIWVEKYLKIEPIYAEEHTEKDVQLEYDKLMQRLQELKQTKDNPNNQGSELTGYFVPFLFDFISNMPKSFIINHPVIFTIVAARIKKIRKKLENLKGLSFQQCFMNFKLIIEHVHYLLIFYETKSTHTLSKHLNDLESNAADLKKIDKKDFTFTSGVACYPNIADVLKIAFEEVKPNVTFEEKSYYELTESNKSLKAWMQKYFTCKMQCFTDSPIESIENIENQDIIFTDLHPNRVVYPFVKTIEIVEIIQYILRKREKSFPFVIVIDCATTFFFTPEVQELLKKLHDEVESGKLIIILTNSFAKFLCMLDDKFPGGMIQVHSSQNNSYAKIICEQLLIRSSRDFFSPQAEKYFYLLLKNCRNHILSFLTIIRKNTNTVYQILDQQGLVIQKKGAWTNPIQVGSRSEKIPMIGLHFNYMHKQLFENDNDDTLNVIVIVMQYYLFAKFIEGGLPITMKPSFGSHSNIIECWSALRLSLGLETELMEKYPEILVKVNNELKSLLTSDRKEGLAKKIQQLNDCARKDKEKNLNQKICEVHASIFPFAQQGFENTIDFLLCAFNRPLT